MRRDVSIGGHYYFPLKHKVMTQLKLQREGKKPPIEIKSIEAKVWKDELNIEDEVGAFLLNIFKESITRGYICSPHTTLNPEWKTGENVKNLEYTETKECYMFHWTNTDTPEAEFGWYHLHSNPFWKWNGSQLCIIKIPQGTQIVAMNKYSSFNENTKVQDERRISLTHVLNYQKNEGEDEDELALIMKEFDSLNKDNTHREFRLPEQTQMEEYEKSRSSTYYVDNDNAEVKVSYYRVAQAPSTTKAAMRRLHARG